MTNLEMYVVNENTSIMEAMKKIDENLQKAVLICRDRKLIATVTDGDIRRYILKNGNLADDVMKISNKSPIFVNMKESIDYKVFMKEHYITILPIVDDEKNILDIKVFYDIKIKSNTLDIPVIIQAGGEGKRMLPYTSVLPKPLIPIGEKTITEHIMDRFKECGCKNYWMIVNYKKNLIKSYFMDEKEENISFIEESKFLGTGGGLFLLKNVIKNTFFLSNCDILIDADYEEIFQYHKQQKNIITIIGAAKKFEIPYGTIEIGNDGIVKSMNEKPKYSFITNTGFYVIEPRFLDSIPENTFIHITELIQNCIQNGERVGMYPISEHAWMDMGQMNEFNRMQERITK